MFSSDTHKYERFLNALLQTIITILNNHNNLPSGRSYRQTLQNSFVPSAITALNQCIL